MKKEIGVLVVLTVLLWGVIGTKLYFGEIKVKLSQTDGKMLTALVDNTTQTKAGIEVVKKNVGRLEQKIGEVKKEIGVMKTTINEINQNLKEVKQIIVVSSAPVVISSVPVSDVNVPIAISTSTTPTTDEGTKFYICPPIGYRDVDVKKVVIKGENSEGKKFKEEFKTGEKKSISLKMGLNVIKYIMYLNDGEETDGKIEIDMPAAGSATFIAGIAGGERK